MVIALEIISKDLVFEITQKIYFSSTKSIMFNECEEFGSVFWTIQRRAELGDEKIINSDKFQELIQKYYQQKFIRIFNINFNYKFYDFLWTNILIFGIESKIDLSSL